MSNLPKMDAQDLDNLLNSGPLQLSTQLYQDTGLLTAPLSSTPCVYYEVEITHETANATDLIGAMASEHPFYAVIKNNLVQTDVVHLDSLAPTFEQTYPSGDFPENLRTLLAERGWLLQAESYPFITVKEKILTPQKQYQLEIKKIGYSLPPADPDGESVEKTATHFYFK